jgi:hypothetical protein
MRVFRKWFAIERKSTLFKRVFGTVDGRSVLAELSAFSHMEVTTAKASLRTGVIDPNAMLIAEGRRQVVLHIAQMLALSYDEIAEMRYNEEGWTNEHSKDDGSDLS